MSQRLWHRHPERDNTSTEDVLQWKRISSDITVSSHKVYTLTQDLLQPQLTRLEESGVVTDCRIRTVQFDPVLDYDFSNSNVVCKLIMSSECLKEIFAELDASSETVQFSISPESRHFRITTEGTSGKCHVSP